MSGSPFLSMESKKPLSLLAAVNGAPPAEGERERRERERERDGARENRAVGRDVMSDLSRYGSDPPQFDIRMHECVRAIGSGT